MSGHKLTCQFRAFQALFKVKEKKVVNDSAIQLECDTCDCGIFINVTCLLPLITKSETEPTIVLFTVEFLSDVRVFTCFNSSLLYDELSAT